MKIVTDNKELEDSLRIKLIDKFKSLLSLDPNIDGIFKQLETPIIKEGVLSEITKDRMEQHILDNMYYNVLYGLEQEYSKEISEFRLKKFYEAKKTENKNKRKKKTKGFGGYLLLFFGEIFGIGKKK